LKLKGFGRSIVGGLDLDSNGYKGKLLHKKSLSFYTIRSIYHNS